MQASAGAHGMYAMLVVGLIINFGSYWLSDRIALRAHGAQPLAPRRGPASRDATYAPSA